MILEWQSTDFIGLYLWIYNTWVVGLYPWINIYNPWIIGLYPWINNPWKKLDPTNLSTEKSMEKIGSNKPVHGFNQIHGYKAHLSTDTMKNPWIHEKIRG